MFQRTSGMGIFFVFPLLNLIKWILKVKPVITSCYISAKYSNLAGLTPQLFFKLLREARVLVFAAGL